MSTTSTLDAAGACELAGANLKARNAKVSHCRGVQSPPQRDRKP